MGEYITPQLAIEKTQSHPAIENAQDDTHPDLIYITSLENTLSIMKSKRIFLNS